MDAFLYSFAIHETKHVNTTIQVLTASLICCMNPFPDGQAALPDETYNNHA